MRRPPAIPLILSLLLAAAPAWAEEPEELDELADPWSAEARRSADTGEDTGAHDGAFIVGLNGGGWVQVPGQAPLSLDRCVGVPVGATLCTDEASFLTVRLAATPDAAGAEDVVLLPGTCVAVEAAGAGRVRLAIQSGGISVSAETPGSDASGLEVRTRDGLTSGAGGGFRVQLEDESTRAEAVAGRVTVENDAGAVELEVGEGSRLRAGEAPEPPVDLLLTEALLAPEDGEVLRRPDFRWAAVPYASSYRVELSADPLFTDIVEATDVAGSDWAPALLFAPTAVDGLWWRVSAYDRFGFLGVPSAPRSLRLPGTAAPTAVPTAVPNGAPPTATPPATGRTDGGTP